MLQLQPEGFPEPCVALFFWSVPGVCRRTQATMFRSPLDNPAFPSFVELVDAINGYVIHYGKELATCINLGLLELLKGFG